MENLILFNGKIHTMEGDTPPAEALAISDGRIVAVGLRSGFGNEYLKFGPVKLLVDGALGGQTAAMCEPYEGDPSKGLSHLC